MDQLTTSCCPWVWERAPRDGTPLDSSCRPHQRTRSFRRSPNFSSRLTQEGACEVAIHSQKPASPDLKLLFESFHRVYCQEKLIRIRRIQMKQPFL